MEPDVIVRVIELYEVRLRKANVPMTRMDPSRTFESLNRKERLAHAHFLCRGAKDYARDPMRQRKAGSHLTAIQMCLSFAGWYTLAELMEHNRQ